jgi:hypothetical protein
VLLDVEVSVEPKFWLVLRIFFGGFLNSYISFATYKQTHKIYKYKLSIKAQKNFIV